MPLSGRACETRRASAGLEPLCSLLPAFKAAISLQCIPSFKIKIFQTKTTQAIDKRREREKPLRGDAQRLLLRMCPFALLIYLEAVSAAVAARGFLVMLSEVHPAVTK